MPFNALGHVKPGTRFPRRLRYRSSHLFHWRASDGWLSHDPTVGLVFAVTGEAATFVRATTGRARDRLGFFPLVASGYPRLEMVDPAGPGGGAPTEPALLTEPITENLINESQTLSAWTATGTPIVEDRKLPDAVGADLYRVEDDDAGSVELIAEACDAFANDDQKGVSWMMAEGPSPAASGSIVRLVDTVAAAARLDFTVTWTAGVPSVVATTGTLIGVERGPLVAGVQLWRILGLSTSVTSANTHEVELRPAGTSAETGDVYASNFQVDDDPWCSAHKVVSGGGGTITNADSLVFTIDAGWLAAIRDAGGGTIYHLWQDLGAFDSPDAVVLWSIGGATDPNLRVLRSAANWTSRFEAGATASVSGTAAAPARLRFQEHLTYIYPDGTVDLRVADAATIAALATAAETAAVRSTTAINVPDAWSAAELRIGCGPANVSHAIGRHLAFKVGIGIQSRETMRREF